MEQIAPIIGIGIGVLWAVMIAVAVVGDALSQPTRTRQILMFAIGVVEVASLFLGMLVTPAYLVLFLVGMFAGYKLHNAPNAS